MEATSKPVLVTSMRATADVLEQTFIGVDGAPGVAGALTLGVVEKSTKSGEMAPLGVVGIFVVEANGVLAIGDEIEVGANAKALKKSAGIAVGRAYSATAQAGELVAIKVY